MSEIAVAGSDVGTESDVEYLSDDDIFSNYANSNDTLSSANGSAASLRSLLEYDEGLEDTASNFSPPSMQDPDDDVNINSSSDSETILNVNLSDDDSIIHSNASTSPPDSPSSPTNSNSSDVIEVPNEPGAGHEHGDNIPVVIVDDVAADIPADVPATPPDQPVQDNAVDQQQLLPDEPMIGGSPSSKRKREEDEESEEDGQTCMICMDLWSNSGTHRLSALRCGHLFGHSCIVRWLQLSQSKKGRRCPQCNDPASIRDIRLLYAKKLIALDTVERDEMKNRLEVVQREKNRLELDLKKSQLTTQLQEKMLTELRTKLADAEMAQVRGSVGNSTQRPESQVKNMVKGDIKLSLEHSVEICKEGGCRVMAFKESLSLVVVSQRSANALFSGYGISKMNSLNFRPTQFVFLHTKPIRDLAFHNLDNELLLSVSLDRCAKLLDISSNTVVQSFQTPCGLWSCSWDMNDSNKFFVGTMNGAVIEFDMRQTRGELSTTQSDATPVTSLVTLPSNPGGALPRGGFVACHLNSCRVYEYSSNGEFVGTQLPLDGPFTGMRYDPSTDHFLISSRPSARSIRGKHIVCELDRMPDKVSLTCNQIQTLNGSTTQNMMSRSCQMKLPGYGSVVASHQESANTIAIWNVANGAKVCNQPAREPVLDMCPITVNQTHYLGTLAEKMFRVYRVET